MKIAVNAKLLELPIDEGTMQYVYQICKNLLKVDQKNSYYFLSAKSIARKLHIPQEKNWVSSPKKLDAFAGGFMFSQFSFAQGSRLLGSDLNFVPWVAPFRTKNTVVKVHDLAPISSITKEVDAYHHRFRPWLSFSLFAKHYSKKAALLLANSEDTKRSIIEKCKVRAEKIKVVPLGVDLEHFSPRKLDEILRVHQEHNLMKPYFIALASCWQPRKNLIALLEAFARLKETGVDLVITGKRGPLYGKMLETINRLHLSERVHLLESLPNKELPPLISGAIGLVFPSLHEGFGMPVLEAMACGCPVITSNVAALPEVGGDAALYVDPFDVESIAFGMEQLLADENKRKEMVSKGLKRASLFTWERTAELTSFAFNELL